MCNIMPTVDDLMEKVDITNGLLNEAKAEIMQLKEACTIYRNASLQSHSNHFDMTQRGGSGCPECIRARDLRQQADNILIKPVRHTPEN